MNLTKKINEHIQSDTDSHAKLINFVELNRKSINCADELIELLQKHEVKTRHDHERLKSEIVNMLIRGDKDESV
ncbi:TPA: hypothetical protein ACX6NV_000573 [Photobacterium damselae]